MALTPLSVMLADARRRHYAVGCYNAINLEMVRGVIEAAECERSPVILCHAEIHMKYTPLEMIAPILLRAAQSASVPVALLLDHGHDFTTIVRAMQLGFNAVMYDGSSLDYAGNLAGTREIVRIAAAMGAEVEAELGHVCRPQSGGAEGDEADTSIDDTSLYTDPQQAADFAEATGVQALAVAFGTAHGVYLKKPCLDLERLKMIRDKTPVPLVMHGGSGLSAADFQSAIQNGISKINFYTGMALSAANRIRQDLQTRPDQAFYHQLVMLAIDSIRTDVRETMQCFASSGKA